MKALLRAALALSFAALGTTALSSIPAVAAPAKTFHLPPPKFIEDETLKADIAGDWRPADDKARDRYRHPYESLEFWGLRPGMTVVDLQPGGGYWTQILAPYAAKTSGRYIAGVADLNNPKMTDAGRKNRAAFEAKFADPKLYGHVEYVGFGKVSGPIAPPGTVDLILTSREIHNWIGGGYLDQKMEAAFAALKPDGVLAVEEHRADPGMQKPEASNGYVAVQTVVDAATKAGFRLDAQSEINANPKDTKNHPFGVWTLPPSRWSMPDGKGVDPKFDHTKYDAIGESDRMTLRFRKPA